jgi:aromatic ring-cleaving dioxygenase
LTGQPHALGEITSYHAHIYFDAAERPRAEKLRALIAERFTVRVGSWHEKPIGPHTKPMYQVAFAAEEFPRFVPWLMLNRDGLSVLVHPNTLWPKDDHLVHALWLGPALPINDSMLPVEVPSRDQVEELPPPNTSPRVQP